MQMDTNAAIKEFDLGDVLSISDGRLVSPRHMEGVYDILNFMTGDNLFTHQLPRALRVCQPALLWQHPQLANVDRETELTPETFLPWLAVQKRIYGETLPVQTLAAQKWVHVDPVLEAEAIIGKDRVITVNV
jgi:hypothetical protein